MYHKNGKSAIYGFYPLKGKVVFYHVLTSFTVFTKRSML